MATPYDLDSPVSDSSYANIEPLPAVADRLRQLLDTPAPAAPPINLRAAANNIDNLLAGQTPVDVTAPAPRTREGIISEKNALSASEPYDPAVSSMNPYNPLQVPQNLATLTPTGATPQIAYPADQQEPNSLLRTLSAVANPFSLDSVPALAHLGEQVAPAALAGVASLAKQAQGIKAGITQDPAAAGIAAQYGNLSGSLGEMGDAVDPGNPVNSMVREVTQNVTEMAPILATDGLLGAGMRGAGVAEGAASKISLGALSAAFGMTAAGSGYSDAVEAGYSHPDLYAIGTGAIAAGTALIPGFNGANSVAKAANMLESQPWNDYLREVIQKYASKDLLQTHGGAMALQGTVQSVLQGALNKETIAPNETWTGIAGDALKAAGFGVLMGEGFGALHHADANAAKDKYVNDMFKQFSQNIEQTQLTGGDGGARVMAVGDQQAPQQEAYTGSSLRTVPTGFEEPERATQVPPPPNASENLPTPPAPIEPAPAAPAPLNSGGSEAALPPPIREPSQTANSPAAWSGMGFGSLRPTPETAPAPAEPVAKEASLPAKGEIVPLSDQFQITRNVRGKVVIQAVDTGRTLATLKTRDAADLDKRQILSDLSNFTQGKATRAWDISTARNNPLLNLARTATGGEVAHADPLEFGKAVASKVTASAEGTAVAGAISGGAISPTALSGLVGEPTMKKGPEAVAAELQKQVKEATAKYLKGELTERVTAGEAAKTPAELLDPKTGELLPPPARKAIFPDKEQLARRVLDILTSNQNVTEDVNEAAKQKAAGLDVEHREPDQSLVQDPSAAQSVAKSGFTEEDALTQFSDEQLKTNGKDDPKKIAAAQEASEIKRQLLDGDATHYDRGIQILTQAFGMKPADAERWMDSDSLFMAPKLGDTATKPGFVPTKGGAKPATSFSSPEQKAFYDQRGLTANSVIVPLQHIAQSSGPFAPLASQLLLVAPDLASVKLGNEGGARPFSHFDAANNTVKIAGDVTNAAQSDQTVVHEALHAATTRRMGMLDPTSPEAMEFQRIFEATQAAFTKATDLAPEDAHLVKYALSHPTELMAMGMSNPETIDFMKSVPMEGGTAWQRFKNWVWNLAFGRPLTTASDMLKNLFDKVMDTPAVSDTDWRAAMSDQTGLTPAMFPAIRNLSDLSGVRDYRGDDLPQEEREIISRKAIANNDWITAPDIQGILARVPEASRGLLSNIIGSRQQVIDEAKKGPGGNLPSSYSAIMADPHLSPDRKSEISGSTMANLLQLEAQHQAIDDRFAKASLKMLDRIPDIEPIINAAHAAQIAHDNAIDQLTSDFKNRILREKETTASDERAQQLTRAAKMLDQLRGSRTALSKYLDAATKAVPLDELLSLTSAKAISDRLREALPINEDTARAIGASTETMRLASVLMANSNVLREELLNLHLVHDPDTLAGANELSEQLNRDIKGGNISNALSHFTAKVGAYSTASERSLALFKALNKEKNQILKSVARLAGAKNALDAIKQAPSFRALWDQVISDNKLVKVMEGRKATGELIYTHPITREPVSIAATYAQEGREENLKKKLDLANAAKQYLVDTANKNYDPKEAAFWRNYIANSAFELDPILNLDARKLVRAGADPYKIIKLAGGVINVPEHVLQWQGGKEAADGQVLLSALSATSSQLSHIVAKHSAGIEIAVDKAAKAHGLSPADWNREVLSPLIASRQQTGYQALRPGSTTIYGHEILPEDEAAFQKQRAMDREVVSVGQEARGNPAVAYNPSKITFESPKGDTLTRKLASTGPDTMPRRLGTRARTLASEWADGTSMEQHLKFMDDNFIPTVMSHVDTVGAPDYSVRSSQGDLYKLAAREHQTTGFTNTKDLVNWMFDNQSRVREPEQEQSEQHITANLVAELDKAFDNITKGFKQSDTPKTEIGAVTKFVGTDNSFTQERGKLIAPPALYDYGLTFKADRLARAHAATSYYAMQMAGENGAMDRIVKALTKQRAAYETQVRSMTAAGMPEAEARAKLTKDTAAAQRRGELLLSYSDADAAVREATAVHEELKRLLSQSYSAADPMAAESLSELTSFTTANLLGGVTSRVKHMFGGISNIMDFNKVVLGRSALKSAIPMAVELAVRGLKDLGTLAAPFSDMARQHMADTLAEHQRMEQIGLSPTANVAEDLKAILGRPKEAGQSQQRPLSRAGTAVKVVESGMRLIGEPLKAYTTRVVDRLLNEMSISMASKVENMLRDSAVRAGNARHDLGERGSFTAPEIFGDHGANPKQELLLRHMFSKLALNMDSLMWQYRDGVADAKSRGEDPNKVAFFTPEQRAGFQYAMASGNSMPTFGNRPTASRGTKMRNTIGQFWGFHLWNASRASLMLAKASTDKNSMRYIPQLMARIATTAAIGATGLLVGNQLKKHIYDETAAIPDISQARDMKQASVALLNGLAGYMPIIGGAINSMFLNQPTGSSGFNPTSQFVMLSLAGDIVNTATKINQEKSAWNPMIQFLRRWAPLTRIVLNQLPSQAGLTDYYNTARDLKNLAPEDMASLKRGGGAEDPTPATPIMQDMINAAYKGNQGGFMQAVDRYLVYEQGLGKTPQDAEQALRASFRAHNPYVMEFGRLPTSAEQQQIYSNANDAQRRELDRVSDVFGTFGSLIGIQDQETKEARGTSGGGSSGSSAGGTGNGGPSFAREGGSSLRDSGYLEGSPLYGDRGGGLLTPPAAEAQTQEGASGILGNSRPAGNSSAAPTGWAQSVGASGGGGGGYGGGSLRLGGGSGPRGGDGGTGHSSHGLSPRTARVSMPRSKVGVGNLRTSIGGGGSSLRVHSPSLRPQQSPSGIASHSKPGRGHRIA